MTPFRVVRSFLSCMAVGCTANAPRSESTVGDLAIESTRYELVQVAPGVFATVAKPEFDPSSFAASMIVVRGDGVLVVDSREGPADALELLAQVRAISSKPVRWLVNTHWHEDHIGGNQVFRDSFPDLTIIGGRESAHDIRVRTQERLDARLERVAARLAEARTALESHPASARDSTKAAERTELIERIARMERYQAESGAIVLVAPAVEVEDEWRLEADDESAEVRVISVGPAHTAGDVAVYLPGLGVLAPGDLLEEGLPWYGDGDPAGWADALARLSALQFSQLVLSHGRIHADRRLMSLQHRFVAAAVGAAKASAEAGLQSEEAARNADLSEYLDAITAELHDAGSLTTEQREKRFASAVSAIFEREYAKRR